jgi:hypothetical protein
MPIREPMPNLPFKLSPAEADALIAIVDDYMAALIVASRSDAIEDAVDLIRARDRLKARLCTGNKDADPPRDFAGRIDWDALG